MKVFNPMWSYIVLCSLLVACKVKFTLQVYIQNHANLMYESADSDDPLLNSSTTLIVRSRLECLAECAVVPTCKAFLYNEMSQFCSIISGSNYGTVGGKLSWQYYVIQGCDEGWREYKESCYLFSEQGNLDWQETEDYCRMNNSKMIEIETAAEYEFIKTYFTALLGYWAAGRHDSSSGSWIWYYSRNIIPTTSGSNFHAWHPSQPDSNGIQGCIMMLEEFHYYWDDYYCFGKGDFICERNRTNAII